MSPLHKLLQTDTAALNQWLRDWYSRQREENRLLQASIWSFNQNKYIPLQWCPLTVEFELVTDALEPIASVAASTVFTAA
jgi:hypothetical protein